MTVYKDKPAAIKTYLPFGKNPKVLIIIHFELFFLWVNKKQSIFYILSIVLAIESTLLALCILSVI